ncbi:hypothetical protein DIPPA_34751 [Diplonema papillatum]|nr:hypothetical protein DIPPA_34751 [Diplonema papillatum]
MRSVGRRWFSKSAVQRWKAQAEDRRSSAPENVLSEAQTLASEAASMKPMRSADFKSTVADLVNKREIQHLLADSISPYDQVDPVVMSALLRDDLDNFLAKCNISHDEFLKQYRDVRGLRTSTRENRDAFRKKYKFDAYAVVYNEEETIIPEELLAQLKIQLLAIRPEKSKLEEEYRWWENQLNDMLSLGYTFSDYEELRRWVAVQKNLQAVILHNFNLLLQVYRICVFTSRIDGVAADKLFAPRYLASWHEITEAFRLDIPEPHAWRPMKPQDAIELVRQVDDYNRGFNGVYNNMSYATLMPHFFDTHVSTHPFKFHCRATGTMLMPSREYIDTLAAYLVERARAFKADTVPILEVGAGTGRLSYHLNQTEAFRSSGIRSIATDATPLLNPFVLQFPRSEQSRFEPFDNEAINESDAVKKYNPAIIICQMMPNGVDWPENWRKNPHVLEYVLIGPADSISCGKPWKTWGVSWGSQVRGLTPTFIRDGFKKVYVDSISRYLITQDDHVQCTGLSRVVSFRRMTALERVFRRNLLYRGRPVLFVAFFTLLAYLTLPED